MFARIALYPGTFDMPTNGHLNLIHRAVRLFPKVIVAVAGNDSKKPLLTVEERVDLLRRITRDLPTVEVATFQGLTVEFAKKIGAKVIVRGLRAVSDFEYELQMALINKQLDPDIETIYLAPDLENSFLSSTATRELMSHGGDLSTFVPLEVKDFLAKRFPKP